MATDLTLERIKQMKELLFSAFNAVSAYPENEPPSDYALERDPGLAERQAQIWEQSRQRHLATNADKLAGLANSFASLALAEVAIETGEVVTSPKPVRTGASGVERSLERTRDR